MRYEHPGVEERKKLNDISKPVLKDVIIGKGKQIGKDAFQRVSINERRPWVDHERRGSQRKESGLL